MSYIRIPDWQSRGRRFVSLILHSRSRFGFIQDNQKDDAPGYELYTLFCSVLKQWVGESQSIIPNWERIITSVE